MIDAHLPVERLSIILGEVKDVRVSQRGPRRTRLDVAAEIGRASCRERV